MQHEQLEIITGIQVYVTLTGNVTERFNSPKRETICLYQKKQKRISTKLSNHDKNAQQTKNRWNVPSVKKDNYVNLH